MDKSGADIDVFNGDADGICALVQLRQAYPVNASLVTGVKRDISLLSRVNAGAGDRVTVLDVSLDKNREPLQRLLADGAQVFFADHHFPGEIPVHPLLTCLVDTDANICTSLLINRHLGGRFLPWAVVGALGDNLLASARQAAEPLGLTEADLQQLLLLGTCINYNAYGESLEDLHFAPDTLFRHLAAYTSPFDFIAEQPDLHRQLLDGYNEDMNSADTTPAHLADERIAVFILPATKWARRVSGVWGNELANREPDRAHAILSCLEGGYQVSVRAPLNRKTGADELCCRFPTGGGRKAAAGINHLPEQELAHFIDAFRQQYA